MIMEQTRGKYTYAIPVGYVFRPEPEELLGFLVESIKLGDQWIQPPEIRNLDLYDKNSNPWTLFGGSSEQPSYVMTRLTKMAAGKSNIKRKAGDGTWKLQKSADVAFRCQDGLKLKGLKRYFAFVPDKDSGCSREEHGHWIMNEYSLFQHGFEDYVICEIHMKPSSKRKQAMDDTHKNQVVMKKMRCTTTLSSTTCATSGRDDGDRRVVRVEVSNYDECLKDIVDLLMKDDIVPTTATPGHLMIAEKIEQVTRSSICDDEDEDDQELIDLIESRVEVEGGVDDIVPSTCDDEDRELVGLIESQVEVDDTVPSTCDDDIVPSTCDDEDQELVDLIESQVEVVACDSAARNVDSEHDRQGMISIQSDHDHHTSSSTSGDHDRDSVVKAGSCPPLPDFPNEFWDGLGFSFSGLDEDPLPADFDFDFTQGFWDCLPSSVA